ncbi:MAG TPA: phosphatase domain-containing protein [Phycisphaerae bacterium]|nr:phosphatase domain-containing protein [Phycisphaerae bacterium]
MLSSSVMRTRFIPLIGLGLTFSACGCFKPVLTATDVVVRPNGTVQLVAFMENATLPGIHNSIRAQRVRFYSGGTTLWHARSGEEGCTTLDCRLPDDAPTYTARARFLLIQFESTGRVFRWRNDRTIIVVDIDDTICDTDTDEVIFQKRDLESSPISRSKPVLTKLAESFHIAYLTARPVALFSKTIHWLDDHTFPPGPVFVAPDLKRMIRQRKYKTEALKRLRADWPNIRVGIGDSEVDARAYGENRMVTLIVGEKTDKDFGRRAIVLPDWSAVEKFFEQNADLLADPAQLGRTLDQGGSFMVPYDAPRSRDGD